VLYSPFWLFRIFHDAAASHCGSTTICDLWSRRCDVGNRYGMNTGSLQNFSMPGKVLGSNTFGCSKIASNISVSWMDFFHLIYIFTQTLDTIISSFRGIHWRKPRKKFVLKCVVWFSVRRSMQQAQNHQSSFLFQYGEWNIHHSMLACSDRNPSLSKRLDLLLFLNFY